MAEPSADLVYAREVRAALREAYKQHVASRGAVKKYTIKDRSMEFHDAGALLKELQFWERQVSALETAEGLRGGRGGRILTRL